MSYELFWEHSDPLLFYDYHEKYLIEMENKRYYDNSIAWLSGLYIQSAVGSLLSKDAKYMEPIDLYEIDRRSRLTEEERNAEDKQKAIEVSRARLSRLAMLTEIENEQKQKEKQTKRKLSTKGGKIVGKISSR